MLKQWLHHTWVDTSAISLKAVKNDKAPVDTRSWDNRIILMLPHVEPLLVRLCNWLLLVQRRRAARQFCRYLPTTYGADWTYRLPALRTNKWQSRPSKSRNTLGVCKTRVGWGMIYKQVWMIEKTTWRMIYQLNPN
jgi:hypothetical protein